MQIGNDMGVEEKPAADRSGSRETRLLHREDLGHEPTVRDGEDGEREGV